MSDETNLMDKITALAKRRGFIYPGSDLYGGLANTYDYGPTGTELLKNIKDLWWNSFVRQRDDIVGLDASLISHQKIWEASGHVTGFSDAMIDCKNCKSRMRADHLIEDALGDKKVEGFSEKDLEKIINENQIKCPVCKKFDWTSVRKFNLLFPVQLGIVEGEGGKGYLRGETAQGIFINFKNVVDSSRVKLPFGIAQLGKSFRNEITPGNSVFRTIEFEQGEIEYFFDPENTKWEDAFEMWRAMMWDFATKSLGAKEENLRWRLHGDEERSFYSKKTEDLEYNFPFGFKELWGLAYRTDYDLVQHMKVSKKDLSIFDPVNNKKITPHVIEPAVGINRLFLMVLIDSYFEDGARTVLKLKPSIAPYKLAIFPLLSNKPELVSKAREIFSLTKHEFATVFDDRGNIGKRYLSQDEVGTPFCLTVDFQTFEDDSVTIRDRDTAQQKRIPAAEVVDFVKSHLR